MSEPLEDVGTEPDNEGVMPDEEIKTKRQYEARRRIEDYFEAKRIRDLLDGCGLDVSIDDFKDTQEEGIQEAD